MSPAVVVFDAIPAAIPLAIDAMFGALRVCPEEVSIQLVTERPGVQYGPLPSEDEVWRSFDGGKGEPVRTAQRLAGCHPARRARSRPRSAWRGHYQRDWQQHRLIIYGKGGPFGTRSKRRIPPLSGRVRALLEPHFSVHDGLGMGPRTVQRLVKRVANRAAVVRPVTPHVLRHTFAVTAVQKGITLPTLQRLLEHDYLGTTQIYLNLSPEDVINEFQRKW